MSIRYENKKCGCDNGNIDKLVDCSRCDGKGYSHGMFGGIKTCPKCDGDKQYYISETCSNCNGRGTTSEVVEKEHRYVDGCFGDRKEYIEDDGERLDIDYDASWH